MRTLKGGEKTIDLDIGEELVVRDFRKIGKFLGDTEDGFAFVANIVGALAADPAKASETLDSMSLAEFQEVSAQLGEMLAVEKKTNP